ncbi:hypothetical protein M2436_002005 [Streptomyces sp. HB372]|nr:hypothetical protein [Streptomyces sp. HB372]
MTYGLALRVLHDVDIDVHRDRDLTVPEDLHHDTWSEPGGGEQGRAAVAGLVQPDRADPAVPATRVNERYRLRGFARTATADESKFLQLPLGETVVELHRTTHTADGKVVEFAFGVHVASRFAWECEFQVPDSATDKENPQ